jgi:hypothetical protein
MWTPTEVTDVAADIAIGLLVAAVYLLWWKAR